MCAYRLASAVQEHRSGHTSAYSVSSDTLPDAAPDVAGGLGEGEDRLVFVGERWDVRDGAMHRNAEGLGVGIPDGNLGSRGFKLKFHQVARYHSYSGLSASLSMTHFRSLPTPCRESAGIWGYGRAPKHAGDGILGCVMNTRETATNIPKSGITTLETAHRLGCGWNW